MKTRLQQLQIQMEHFQVEEYISFSTMLNTLQVEYFRMARLNASVSRYPQCFMIGTQMSHMLLALISHWLQHRQYYSCWSRYAVNDKLLTVHVQLNCTF